MLSSRRPVRRKETPQKTEGPLASSTNGPFLHYSLLIELIGKGTRQIQDR